MHAVRPYRPGDEQALLAAWGEALPADPIDATTWRRRVLLDPNFDPEGCLVAGDGGGGVSGLLLSLVRRVPFYGDGLDPDVGWITAFAVRPPHRGRGVGSALLDAALARMRALGRHEVRIAPYVPGYVVPGVDVDAHAGGLRFLRGRGFVASGEAIAMTADLGAADVRARVASALNDTGGGVVVRPACARDIVPLLELVRTEFGWDWYREASEALAAVTAGDPRGMGVAVAERGGELLGYAQHRGERFGPFGVRRAARGGGIGARVLAATMRAMAARGLRAAWFLWTDERAARLYRRLGFAPTRRFALLSRRLGEA